MNVFGSLRPFSQRRLCLSRAEWKGKERIGAAVAVAICVPYFWTQSISASELFDRSCAGCHIGGGNIVGGRTLKLKDLEAEGLLDADSLVQVIANGRRRMPGFGQSCTPQGQCTFGAKLTEVEIQSLAEFVLDQAQNGWK
eukprot:g3412.t1